MKIGLFVFIGGGIGAVVRYIISKCVSEVYEGYFPIATFMINMIGCLLIGILAGLVFKNSSAETAWKALLVTGFCGGFTTFSTFSIENITLLQKGENAMMLFYTALSIFVGLLFTYLGIRLQLYFDTN